MDGQCRPEKRDVLEASLTSWVPYAQFHDDGEPRDSGRQFRPEEIGVKKYNSVRGSVSKAFKRLELRGYVKRYGGFGRKWTGIVLTSAGLSVAKAMLEAGEAPKKQQREKTSRPDKRCEGALRSDYG